MRWRVALGVVVVIVALAAAPGALAAPADGSGLIVTVAARECPTYQDIRANLARNNIMESLQDLGEDTLYTSGEPINPQLEAQGQPNCEPITGWQFTVGSGYREKASTGVWGALSIVTGAESPTVVTKATTPLLGWHGEPIPGVTLKGATTFELSQAQAERAGANGLWIQGGTTTDPVLFSDPAFVGKYGFGALRCSIDDLNGDNVETIAFPTGTTHAFCYAYYVTPPPSSGTIVIRKEVEGSASTAQDFQFGGNVSYNPGGAFDLSSSPGQPAETTFFRGETRPGESPWTVHEQVPEGWALTGLHCESAGSQVTTDRASAAVSIRLAAGDTVTCTYVDELKPPKGALLIRKVTEDGTGTFDFRVLDSHDRAVKSLRVKTDVEGRPAYAKALVVDPGRYRIVEHSPVDPRGEWHSVRADCNGERESAADEAAVSISASSGAVCTFTNRLVHPGRITIRKVAIGGVGSAGFQITSPAYPTSERNQIAVVKKEGTPVLAKGDPTRDLPFGTYVIQESAGQGTNAADWSLVEVICDGKAVPFSQGRAVVHLSRHDPSANCRFVNLFTPTPPGPAPKPPAPGPQPGESAEIAVAKTLVSSGSGPTPTSLYRVTVKNLSGVTASDVVVTDQPGPGLVIVAAEASGGASCIRVTQYLCSFPSIAPHGEETVLVTAKDYGGGGTYNRAVLSSASPDDNAANNVAAAHTEKPVRNYPACGSRVLLVSARC